MFHGHGLRHELSLGSFAWKEDREMGGPSLCCCLALWLFLLLATAIADDRTTIQPAAIGISSHLPSCAFVLGNKFSAPIKPPAFLSSAWPPYTSSSVLPRASQNHRPALQQRHLSGSRRQIQRAVVRRLQASASHCYEGDREDKDTQQAYKPSFASRVLATGCYLMPTVDSLQAFAPLPALGRLAGRLAWGCNVASMAASFLVLRKKLLPAPPFVKHHLMTASLLSMCSFTLANIHYKVLSFFLAGRAALRESLGFASGASVLSLICRAAVSAASGRPAALPVLSEAVALHLGPDNYSAS